MGALPVVRFSRKERSDVKKKIPSRTILWENGGLRDWNKIIASMATRTNIRTQGAF